MGCESLSLLSKASAGGQLEQPSEVKSSTITVCFPVDAGVVCVAPERAMSAAPARAAVNPARYSALLIGMGEALLGIGVFFAAKVTRVVLRRCQDIGRAEP